MNKLDSLLSEVEQARIDFLSEAIEVSPQQAAFKPSPDAWSMTEIVEHMVWAERVGVAGMWKAIEGKKTGKPIWEGDNPNRELSIEEVVDQTWQAKEKVPKVAEPKWGGALGFWTASLEACSATLSKLGEELRGMDLEQIVYPHPISGPLHVVQRLAFLRFHLNRHQGQIQRLKSHPDFPR